MKYQIYQADYSDPTFWIDVITYSNFQEAVEMMNLLQDLTDDEDLYYGIEDVEE